MQKLTMVIFLLYCTMGQWTSVMKQEVVYVAFADPEIGKPTFVFLAVVALSESQDAPVLK